MQTSGVTNIPSGLVICLANQVQVGIEELFTDGVLLRTESSIDTLEFKFYEEEKREYKAIKITSFQIVSMVKKTGYDCSRILILEEEYKQQVYKILHDYYQYRKDKMEEGDAYTSEQRTYYKQEWEEEFCNDKKEQESFWWSQYSLDSLFFVCQSYQVSYAGCLDSTKRYELAQRLGIRAAWNQIAKECQLHHVTLSRIYLGNEFCHLLFPKPDVLFSLMEQAMKEQLQITVCFTYVREEFYDDTKKLLEQINEWCRNHHITIEVVVNDWGMASWFINDLFCIKPVFGILLNKRRKDPRYQTLFDADKVLLQQKEIAVNDVNYQTYLKKRFRIEKYELESCGYDITIPKGEISLLLPFYQTNTSQYCGLYAVLNKGQRFMQTLLKSCPEYCKDAAFLYPKQLHMIGKGNSLFALDTSLFYDPKRLEELIRQGVRQIVWNL